MEENLQAPIFTAKQILNFVMDGDHYQDAWPKEKLTPYDTLTAMKIYGEQCVKVALEKDKNNVPV